MPANTASLSDPDMICLDRFGNTYDIPILHAEFENPGRSRSVVGYFELSMNLDSEMEDVIEDVFSYLSSVILQRTNTTGCEDVIPGSLVKIIISEGALSEGALAAATPMYFNLDRTGCDDVLINMVDLTINGGLNDTGVDGAIVISNDSEFTFYTGTGSPGNGEFDLYTIILHEALHLLGFASIINRNGVANSGFYSVWDQFLYTTTAYVNGGPSLGMEPLLTSNCEDNCWVMNSEVFEDAEEFVHALEDNCNISGSLDFIFGENAIAPLDGTSPQVQSSLSHLNGTCNGQNINYVMKPSLAAGEARRTISTPENDILCQLGYLLDDYCNMCYLTVLPEDVNATTFESCCEIFINVCEGEQTLVPFEDLLCNDFSDGVIEITDYYTNPGSGLTVSTNGSGFLVTPSSQGIKTLFYTVKGCDCRMLNGYARIYVGPCTDCEEIDPCENLVCVEDFEEFDPGIGLFNIHVEACGKYWWTETGNNSVDICEDGTGNNYLNLGSTGSNREGFCMRLSEPVGPGCRLTIEFDAAARVVSGFDWYVSVEPPCDYLDANVFSNGNPTNCDSYTFEPFFIGQKKITNSVGVIEHVCVDDPNLQPYIHYWDNDISIEANYLILFPTPTALPWPANYIDNIIVTKNCLDPSFTFTQNEEECLEIQFNSGEGLESDDHSWNFGDTNTSTAEDPIHEYSSPGNYTITHTVTDACGNSSSASLALKVEGCCEDFTVTTNTTWTIMSPIPNKGVFHTLTIQEGVSLTVDTGVELQFCPGGSVIVEAGAHMRNKGTLTSYTSINWEGVFLEGNPSFSQSSSISLYPWAYGFIPQGYFWADENSLIENATIGVRNYGPASFNPPAGGILKATGATFRNNGIGVDFRHYENFSGSQPAPDRSSFSDCIFENTSTYSNQNPFWAFARLNGVYDIRFNGCEFTNEFIPANGFSYSDFGRGIDAISSSFEVRATNPPLPCLPPNDCGSFCTFNGLGHGIHVSTLLDMRSYKIIQAEFENCWRGITSDDASGGTIVLNEFVFGSTPVIFGNVPEDQIGIQLQDIHVGFEIQENSFEYDAEGETNAIGIKCEAIGIAPNVIRRNYFSGMNIAHEAYGRNALNTEINSSGLRLLCEEMEDTDTDGADIYIPETGVVDNIYIIQGELNHVTSDYVAAGNLFSIPGLDIQNDNDFLGNTEERVFYFWYDDTFQEPLTGDGFFKFESIEENECHVEYRIPPGMGVVNVADEKNRHYTAKSDISVNLEDYIEAMEEEDFETAEEKKRLLETNTYTAFQSAYNLMQYIWHDTISFNYDTLMKWYERMDYFGADLLAAGEVARRDGYDDAVVFLSDIPLNRDLTPEEEMDLDKIIAIYSMLDTSDVYDLSVSQRNGLRSMAQTSQGSSSALARTILSFYQESFPLTYYLIEETKPPVAYRSADSILHESIPTDRILAMPVPAEDYVLLKWKVPVNSDGMWLSLFDYIGKEVARVPLAKDQVEAEVDITQLNPGLYIALISGENFSISACKLVKK